MSLYIFLYFLGAFFFAGVGLAIIVVEFLLQKRRE